MGLTQYKSEPKREHPRFKTCEKCHQTAFSLTTISHTHKYDMKQDRMFLCFPCGIVFSQKKVEVVKIE